MAAKHHFSPKRGSDAAKRSPSKPPLGPDSVRRDAVARALAAARVGPKTSFRAFEFPSGLDAPRRPLIAIGDAIQLADGVRVFEQSARALARGVRDPAGPLGAFLLQDDPAPHLAWLRPLKSPLLFAEALVPTFERQLALFRPEGGPIAAQYYAMLQAVPNLDLDLVKYVVKMALPSARGYDAHVALALMAVAPDLPYDAFRDRLAAWRFEGLLFPLLVAARHMPALNDWLPVELQPPAAAWQDVLDGLNAARNQADLDAALDRIDQHLDWGGHAGLFISSLLDRAAVQMRVLSHRSTDLDAALALFPHWAEARTPQIWREIKAALEAAIPPSALCPRLAGYKSPTWGYAALTPLYSPATGLAFAEQKLEWVEPAPDRPPEPVRGRLQVCPMLVSLTFHNLT